MKAYRLIGTKKIFIDSFNNKRKGNDKFEELTLPCGSCLGCRLARSKDWAVRCVHEAQLYEDNNCFVTLTFSDKYLAKDNSLHKEDFQNFMKRLRRKYIGACEVVDKSTGEVKRPIRYFHCGDYGEANNRPHHHACIFNFKPKDLEYWDSRKGVPVYRSAELESIWTSVKTKETKGYVTIGEVTWQSAAYVARYVVSKITGDMQKEVYQGRLPPYCTSSRRPGIGKYWYEKFKEDIHGKDFITINGKKFSSPRYYDRLLEAEDPERLKLIKENRKEKMKRERVFTFQESVSMRKNLESLKKHLVRDL